jgi:phosphoglycolate phosphatase
MKKYRYIFWDLDGTIVNSFEGVTNCVQYALGHFGITVEGEANLRRFIGPPLRQSFPEYCGLSAEQTEEAVRLYRERYIPIGVYECELFPRVREALAAFRMAGLFQVLTSSKPEAQCKQVLEKFHLVEQLDEIVGASPDGRIDTKLEVLNEAFRRLEARDASFSRDQVVLIGDTRYDAQGAAQAGIDCIGVSYGFGTPEELLESGALAVYSDLCSLVTDLLG